MARIREDRLRSEIGALEKENSAFQREFGFVRNNRDFGFLEQLEDHFPYLIFVLDWENRNYGLRKSDRCCVRLIEGVFASLFPRKASKSKNWASTGEIALFTLEMRMRNGRPGRRAIFRKR
jgi:hypothetical protein